jgi:uncharacterized membrane protein
VEQFANWLANTKASLLIQDVAWIVPTVQTVHILAIAMVFSSVAMISLRIFGLAGTRSTLPETLRRYAPWIWGSVAVLAVSGVIMITGEPVRALTNSIFQLKMLMLATALVITGVFERSVHGAAPRWADRSEATWVAKAAALGVFLLWCAIVIAGRWIAYTADNQ